MLLIAKTPRGEGAIVGWCPNKDGKPTAILVSTVGTLIYAPISEVELLNLPKKVAKRAIRIHKQNQKRDMKEIIGVVTKAGTELNGSPN